MRTPTGQYRIDYFNTYGERISGTAEQAFSLMQSHEKAADTLQLPGMKGASYTVMRCLFNSLDKGANL